MNTTPQEGSGPDDAAADRWQWLGVIGAGLIAAAITAIEWPAWLEDSPPPPTAAAKQPA